MPSEAPAPSLDVTVVVPVRNEGAHVDAVLDDLLAQDIARERVEILVVDGRSTDDTRARVKARAAADARVRLLDNPARRSSSGRAIGAAAARGRFVAYVDGHCRVDNRSMLSQMVALFERTGADCLARPQPLVPEGGGAVARAIAAARATAFGHSTRSEIFGDREGPVSPVSSGAMYRREVFDRVGTFDPAFDACEDVEFNTRVERAGLRSFTSPALAVRYEPRRSYRALLRQMARYGLGRARLHRKHAGSFTVESLVPVAFVLGLVTLAASPWLPRALSTPVYAAYALYVALALAFGAVAARRGRAAWPLVAIAFPVVHVGLGVGYLRGWLTSARGRDGDDVPAIVPSGPLVASVGHPVPARPGPRGAHALFTVIVKPFAARLRGNDAPRRVRGAAALLSLPADAMRRHRADALRGLLVHARATVPWYRDQFDAVGFDPVTFRDVAELERLPRLTRTDLAGAADRLLSSAYAGVPLVEARSGGTTSAPVPFVQTRGAIAWKDAAAEVMKARIGWRSGHRAAFLWGAAADGPLEHVDSLRGLASAAVHRLVDRSLWLPASDLSDARLDAHAERIRRFRPHALQAYPSAADLLARRLLERGDRLDVPVVLLTAETIFPEQRERIARAMSSDVFSFYGARECGWIAGECLEHRLHVNTACVHVERDAGGGLLVTDLVNRAMPLIRYEIGDVGTLDAAPCSCGDERPVVASIEGRLNDVFVLPSGRRVPGVIADLRAYSIGLGVLEAQLVQDEPAALDVHWVASPTYADGDEHRMAHHLERLFFGELLLRLHRVERLARAPNGKVRYCVSRVGTATP